MEVPCPALHEQGVVVSDGSEREGEWMREWHKGLNDHRTLAVTLGGQSRMPSALFTAEKTSEHLSTPGPLTPLLPLQPGWDQGHCLLHSGRDRCGCYDQRTLAWSG